jgi:PBP1b-binding outer membrane lipoprotein LpoB
MSTAKTVLIIAVLCVVLSGCIETREYECRDDTGKKQQITDINTVDVDDITDCDNKSVIMIVNRKVYKG